MSIIVSKVNPRSEDFSDNQAYMSDLIGDLTQVVALIKEGGGFLEGRENEHHCFKG